MKSKENTNLLYIVLNINSVEKSKIILEEIRYFKELKNFDEKTKHVFETKDNKIFIIDYELFL